MSGEVIPFRRPEPSEPTQEGAAVCLSCAHEWVAVVPVGTPVNAPGEVSGLECPKCHSLKGVMKRFLVYDKCPTWHCEKCTSFLFTIFQASDGTPCVGCACCGNLRNAIDLFN